MNSTPCLPPESLYGDRKRLRFFLRQLDRRFPDGLVSVAELGCGTGEALLLPLAAAFRPGASFLGIDSHGPTIERAQARARALGLTQVSFQHAVGERIGADSENEHDAVIVSEVLEHVKDPFALLSAANRLLKDNGLLLITIPNGYGPFEFQHLLWNGSGFGRWWNRLRGRSPDDGMATLNVDNGHVGFYRRWEIEELVTAAGFDLTAFRNREWISGPFTDLVHAAAKRVGLGSVLVDLNERAGDFVPSAWASDWMIAARKSGHPVSGATFVGPSDRFARWWWNLKSRATRPRRG